MTQIPGAEERDERVLILAPSRRDGPTVAAILERAGLGTQTVATLAELCRAMEEGVGAAIVVEEAVSPPPAMAMLQACLERLPAWSEPPILVVTASGSRGSAGFGRGSEHFAGFGNLVLLERPLRSVTLVSTLHSALRARRRQYQVRDHLRERERAEARLRAQEQDLRDLNETLEERVRERTAELEATNRRLAVEMEQRQEAERALRQAQKMEAIGQLTGGVAHDFNNLLMVVSGGLDMLGRAPDPERRERIVSGMRQAVTRGASLTRQLLAFSRRMSLAPEAIDLRARFDDMRILMTGALREDIALEVELAEDLWPVMADQTQLELAILNTVVNARDAMPQGGTVTIFAGNARLDGRGESRLTGDFVRIEVRDTGTGIAPDVLDRIFDPFFTTKEVGSGTGLGLSQVYGFAKQSGGHVKVRSRVGEGTRIILHLPRANSLPLAAAVEASPPAIPVPGPKGERRILLVEDNDEVAELAGQMLEGLGFTVRRAESAPAALAQLENGHAADLVFSDVVMPGGMSGIELARELARRRPGLPVVLTSGFSDGQRDGDADGLKLLRKPYRLDELEAALAAALGAHLSSG
ncbi:ATP-binding protein [Sphingomonas sp. 3F27F9]|jgi:signal transduction histidine kinase|uniref:ATP-binding protein n=2 Tax=Sphingomonas TaxID=13687 RepID=UPI0010F95C3D|nr:ATP-binding protein [Sphingomonas sp. 3F27F9]